MALYRRASRRRYVLLLIVLSALTLITLDRRTNRSGALGAASRAAHTVVSPVEGAVDAVVRPVGDWFSGLSNGHALKRENARLRRRVVELEGNRRQGEVARDENKLLKRELDLDILDDVKRHTARVVNASPGNFEATITLDKGTEVGIARDMPVIQADGVVGKVITAWNGGCKVRLLVDPEAGIGVRVTRPQAPTGIAQGRAGSEVLTVELPADAVVERGDRVETSGLQNSDFPPGLSVGNVMKVDDEPGGLGKRAQVQPYVDFDQLEFVTVLIWVPGQPGVVATTSTTTTTTIPTPSPFGVETTTTSTVP